MASRYYVRLTVDVYEREDDAVGLVNYCRNSRRPPGKELVLNALDACYGPYALEQSKDSSPEQVEQKARESIAKLESFILQIRHRYNIAVNSSLYHPGMVSVPAQFALAPGSESGFHSVQALPGAGIPLINAELPKQTVEPAMAGITDDDEAQEALSRFLGNDAEIILQEFPFGISS